MSQNKTISFLEQVVSYLLVRAKCHHLPVNLDALATHLGVKEILRRPMAAEGYVEPIPDDGYRIVVRSDRSRQRQNFSIAHELGHIVMHKLAQRPTTGLARQYRAFTSVSSKMNEESIADTIAGIILLPPWSLSQELPERFSIRTIVSLACEANASIPTALIRAIWYCTNPCIAFHLRVYDRDISTVKCLWTRSSRSVPHVATDVLTNELANAAVLQQCFEDFQSPFAELSCTGRSLSRIDLHRKRFGSRDLVYGIAHLTADGVKHLSSSAADQGCLSADLGRITL